MTLFLTGLRVEFKPKKGKIREGVIASAARAKKGHRLVLLDGDPFPIELRVSQLSACGNVPNEVPSNKKVPKSGPSNRRDNKSMTDTATKPSAKKLRKEAQALGIKGWEDMGREEMAKAIRKAKKHSSNGKTASEPVAKKSKLKKTNKVKAEVSEEKPAKSSKGKLKAKKTAAKKAPEKTTKVASTKSADEALGLTFCKNAPKTLPPEGENPFRRKSNMFKIAKLLLKGGTRRVLAEKLAASAEIHPYHKADGEIDLLDYDKRLLLGAQTMRDKFGYGIQRQGRSIDGKILVFRPGGPKDPRKKGSK